VGCYIWYSEEGHGRAGVPLSPLIAVPNVTAHPSTVSVPITVLLYDGPLLYGFNVAIKGIIIFNKYRLKAPQGDKLPYNGPCYLREIFFL